MATKFARESLTGDHHSTPYRRLPTPAPGKGRRLWIYFCFLALLLCLLFGPALSTGLFNGGFIRAAIQHGEAVVLAKIPADDGGKAFIEIAVALPKGGEAKMQVPFPEPYWTPIQPGDRIVVVFRPNLDGKTVKILETGLVALPPALR